MTNLIILNAMLEGMKSFLPLILIVIVFYFFFIRPQNKQKEESKTMLDNLTKGDKLVTAGGIHGKFLKDNGTSLVIEIDTNTKITVEKSSISLEMTKLARQNTTSESTKV